jgi:hypothetical protein
MARIAIDMIASQSGFHELVGCAALEFTEIIQVRVNPGPGYTRDTPLPIREAMELLERGALRGVQIHYRYQNATWIDSLRTVSEGIQVVRVRHDVVCDV